MREVFKLPPAWEKLTTSKRDRFIEVATSRTYRRLGLILSARMRRKIRGGVPPKNSPLTIALKGSSKPLADKGRLFKSITWKIEGTGTTRQLRVGVIRTDDEGANVAKIVHEGARIVVTPKMSRLFSLVSSYTLGRPTPTLHGRALELATRAKGVVYPMRVGSVIVIPPRPFARMVLTDPATPKDVRRVFLEELDRAFKGETR